MDYRISRGGETYGPYTEAELRDYIASGNVSLSDLARSDKMKKWRPVRRVLPKQKKARPQTLQVQGFRADVLSPPDIPWWMAFVLDVLTGFSFFVAWDIIEGIWIYRVRGKSRALAYYVIAGVLFAINAPAYYSAVNDVTGNSLGVPWHTKLLGFTGILLAATTIALRIVGRFVMRRELLEHYSQEEPVGLQLSWWKTLLLGGLYFQYHFNHINELKRPIPAKPARP